MQHVYLVNFGLGGFLGRFAANQAHARGERVLIRSARGVELGTVLAEVKDKPEGPIIGCASGDESGHSYPAAPSRAQIATIIDEAQTRAAADCLPVQFLDGEAIIDPPEVVLHAVHWGACDATQLFADLTQRFGVQVKLADVTTPAKAAHVCSTCGAEKSGCDSCGSGGGCSTGSCSSGSVKSAAELTAYFAGLRKQMESVANRVSLD